MTTSEPETQPKRTSFAELNWQTKWIVVAGLCLAALYSVRFVDGQWLFQWPTTLVLVLTGLIPQLFLLLFPLLTYQRKPGVRIGVPPGRQWLIESAVALPIVGLTVTLLCGLNLWVMQRTSGESLTPDAIETMATWMEPRLVYILLVFSFTLAPVAEEVFFRGFLYNVFCRWMPIPIAAVTQSLIFGFCHFFGNTHAVIACGLGLIMTVVYQWRKTLVTPVLVHAGFNVISALGVVAIMADAADRPSMGVVRAPGETSCHVHEVVPGSAAAEAGIVAGDLITDIDGRPVNEFKELAAYVSAREVGDTVHITIEREGETLQVDVILKRRGPPAPRR